MSKDKPKPEISAEENRRLLREGARAIEVSEEDAQRLADAARRQRENDDDTS